MPSNGIDEIDGVFVPCTIVDDGEIIYWGYGYRTIKAARRAVNRTEHGHETPPGFCRVCQTHGTRIKTDQRPMSSPWPCKESSHAQ